MYLFFCFVPCFVHGCVVVRKARLCKVQLLHSGVAIQAQNTTDSLIIIIHCIGLWLWYSSILCPAQCWRLVSLEGGVKNNRLLFIIVPQNMRLVISVFFMYRGYDRHLIEFMTAQQPWIWWLQATQSWVVLQTTNQRICTITEKAPTRVFSWLKAATTAFTFKTLLRHYACWSHCK